MFISIIAAIAYCYAGTNPGAKDKQTLHVLECDTETGSAKIVDTVRGVQGTTYFDFDATGTTMYTYIGEARDGKKRAGSIVSFEIKGAKFGEMKRLGKLECETPCHISLSPDAKYLAYAAYTSASAGTMSAEGGEALMTVHANEGMGTDKERQEKAHAHCAFFTPDSKRVGIIDLGVDRIFFYDPKTMKRDDALTIVADPGDGPRHAIWAKDNRFLYIINELGNSVLVYAYNGKNFNRVQKISTLPGGCTDWSKASAIKLTKDGEILMASNRGYDSIAFYQVNKQTGLLKLVSIPKLKGSFPRDFELMPGEKFMVVGHERDSEIQIYRFNRNDCSLEAVGAPIEAFKPLVFKFAN